MQSLFSDPSKIIYTVKEFNELVNIVLTEKVGEVSIQGEITGYQIRQGKWISFDLKDSESVINCFATTYQIDMPLSDGMEVVVTGTPRLYVPYGKYSFNVRNVQLKGEGALKKAFEDLKKKLTTEGLFDPIHKRSLPRFPEKIGIITSGEGAAVNDILKVINGRWGGLEIYLAPVLVQGKNAPDELVGAIQYFNQRFPVDVVIFGRGGGSLEDLQAFNSERVARAIFASRIPIVAGIGHEHNTSIADLVADVRAATPSNAAEICVPDRAAIAREVEFLSHKAERLVQQRIMSHRHHLNNQTQTLELFVSTRFARIRSLITRVPQLLHSYQEKTRLIHQKIAMSHTHLSQRMNDRFETSLRQLKEKEKLLAALNPTAILKRGYSITYATGTGTPITRLADIPADGRIRTALSDGIIESHISEAGREIKKSPPAKTVKITLEKAQETLF
ncbi:MAG TPA: exodeoxyribonuclease VII large subunit [Patescibacteria group bacterium]